MRISFFIIFTLIVQLNIAQNLVLNPGFEEVNLDRPRSHCQYTRVDTDFEAAITKWGTFQSLTPDVAIWDTTYVKDCPFPDAHSGKRMLGLIPYHPGIDLNFFNDYHEVVQGQLTEALKPGKTYNIRFFIQQNKAVAAHHIQLLYAGRETAVPVACNNIGFYFLEKRYLRVKNIWDLIKNGQIKPHFNIEEIVQTEDGEWLEITGRFTADAPYKYFLIGNFFTDEATQTDLSTNLKEEVAGYPKLFYMTDRKRIAYYLIDDVFIGEGEAEAEENIAENIYIQLETKGTYTFENVNFETNKWDLLPEALVELNALLNYLKTKPSIKVEIGGHTDSVGKDEDNQVLSENRAKAVFQYLVDNGISENQLLYRGYGEAIPTDTNETEEGRLNNRRVECVIQED